MSQLYDEIPLGPRQVRLLRLCQNTSTDTLTFEMKAFPLDDMTPYTALSYCWGKDAPSEPVTINTHTMLVRSNLFSWLQLASKHHS